MSKEYDILGIDDEKVVLDAIEKICTADGFKVDLSLSAVDAMKRIESNRYKLIVCDIMMPDMDGFQFLEQIRIKNIPSQVIMTTGYTTVENAVKSLNNGAIDFIPKPFTADEILNPIYRGMKYLEIQSMISKRKSYNNDSDIIYVPCPSKYFRLGYGSWISVEFDGSILIGITDLFLKTIDPVSEVSLINLEDEIIQGTTCAHLTAGKGLLHNIMSPISGRVIDENTNLISEPDILEKDPYFEGWFYRVIPSDLNYELKNLIPCSSDRL